MSCGREALLKLKQNFTPLKPPCLENKTMTKNDVYIHVDAPLQLRREILEAAKSSLSTLKGCAQFRKVREEKLETAHTLKEMMKELKALNTQLVSMMPEMSVEERAGKVVKEQKKKRIRVEPLQVDKVEQLEEALHDIESKLNRLG